MHVASQCDSSLTLGVVLQEISKPMPTSNWWETISDRELEDILDTFDRIQLDNWWDLTPEEERMAIAAADEAARRYMDIRGSQTSTRTRVRYTELNERARPKKKSRRGI